MYFAFNVCRFLFIWLYILRVSVSQFCKATRKISNTGYHVMLPKWGGEKPLLITL